MKRTIEANREDFKLASRELYEAAKAFDKSIAVEAEKKERLAALPEGKRVVDLDDLPMADTTIEAWRANAKALYSIAKQLLIG